MKRLGLLKLIFEVLYFVSCIAILLFSIGYVMLMLGFDLSEYFKIVDYLDKPYHNAMLQVIVPFIIVGYFLFVLILRSFKRIIQHFFEHRFFSVDVAKLFYRIGLFFIASTVLITLPPWIYALFAEPGHIRFDFSVGFDSSYFLVAIGLFFIVLSDIFKKAITIREDSELTI